MAELFIQSFKYTSEWHVVQFELGHVLESVIHGKVSLSALQSVSVEVLQLSLMADSFIHMC